MSGGSWMKFGTESNCNSGADVDCANADGLKTTNSPASHRFMKTSLSAALIGYVHACAHYTERAGGTTIAQALWRPFGMARPLRWTEILDADIENNRGSCAVLHGPCRCGTSQFLQGAAGQSDRRIRNRRRLRCLRPAHCTTFGSSHSGAAKRRRPKHAGGRQPACRQLPL